jgi:dihydroorotate dehydrogenase (NAD+) catalytic subunit
VRQPLDGSVDFRRRHQLGLFDDAHRVNILAWSPPLPKRALRREPGFPRLFHKPSTQLIEPHDKISGVTASAAPDLSVNVGALRLSNPIIAASGTFGYGVEFARVVDLDRLGGIVVKGLSLEPMAGAPAPRLCETPSGMLNAVGLQNIGVRAFIAEKLPALRQYRTAIVANVFGYSVEEYVAVIRALEEAEGLAAYELNISCPNTTHGGIQFGSDPLLASEVVSAARQAARRPLWVKLSPNVTDITVIARAAQEAGADALTVANTYQAMSIDVRTRRSRLGRATGGLSGPAIKPITLRLVYEASRAVKIPVIGLGGIEKADDVLEYFIAGASAVQVGTANFARPSACLDTLKHVENLCMDTKVLRISELTATFQADCP